MLYQQLTNLSFGHFEISTSGARASDIVPLIDNRLADEVHDRMIVLY